MPAKSHGSAGTLLAIKISSTFTTIGLRVELKGPASSLEMRKVTHLDSTSVEKAPAIPDLGTLSGTIYFDPDDTTHILCRARVLTPPATPDEFKLTYPTEDTTKPFDDFFGYFAKFEVNPGTVMDTRTADFEIEITTSLTATPGTP